MTAKFFTCKQSAGAGQCGAKFHEDDKEEFIEHLAAHGVDTSTLKRMPWWDEEGGFSISPTDRVPEGTPVSREQFGDGSEEQRRDNRSKWQNLKELEKTSKRNMPASAFFGAHVVTRAEKKTSARVIEHGRADDVKPSDRAAAGKPLTSPAPCSGVGSIASAVGQNEAQSKKAVRGATPRKETVMGTKKVEVEKVQETNPYADAPVISLSASGWDAAMPRICVTTGRGYKDVAAIRSILELVQKNQPTAVVANQGFYEGDKLVITIARSLGIETETFTPKFIEARRRQAPLFDESHRMTPEENAEVGYVELQHRMAENCTELHIFGSPSGPQRGLAEAFEDVDKKVFQWGGSVDDSE